MIKKGLCYTFLILCTLVMLAPFVLMVMISFSSGQQLDFSDVDGIVRHLTLDNYHHVTNSIRIEQYFLNSMMVSVLTTIGQILISTPAGYAFAKLKFKGRDLLFFIILITMFIPPQVNIIPLFFLMRELHLVNSYPALILPGIFGGFGIFLMRQHFLSFPDELEDASTIDGCTKLEMFFKIAFPLAMPAVATLAVFTFITSWNSFIWPLIITNSDSMMTLPLGLATFKGSYREIIEWGDLLACSVICTLPTIIVFLIGQRYIINDMLKGGVKE